MDILGIGIPELVFIILIALIVLGPKDMQKARTVQKPQPKNFTLEKRLYSSGHHL